MAEDADIQRKDMLRNIENRAKIYLTLIETGELSNNELSKQTKITQPDVKSALDELKKMGIIHEATNEHSFQIERQAHPKRKRA